MKKFIESVGSASTTASLDGRKIGYNVNAAAYQDSKTGVVKVVLESNSSRVRQAPAKEFSNMEAYNDWKELIVEHSGRKLFVAAIESFGAEVWL